MLLSYVAMPDGKSVFVIHGRNEVARQAMFSFLRAIGLAPIEWTEAVSATGQTNPFIGTILDAAMDRAQAFVVLVTGDDVARLGTRYGREALAPQARPNVLFEAGMAMGRFPDRTVLVTLGSNRQFSDIAGRHVLEMENNVAKRQQLARRLEEAGCQVSINDQTDWHKEGDFHRALVDPDKRPLLARRFLGLAACLLALLVSATIYVLTLRRPSPAAPAPAVSSMEVITISGRITRAHPPNDGITVGVIPAGALTVTDSAGLYKITLPGPVALGSYTAVTYEYGKKPYLGSIAIENGRATFDYTER